VFEAALSMPIAIGLTVVILVDLVQIQSIIIPIGQLMSKKMKHGLIV
jgi:hypothetical protein